MKAFEAHEFGPVCAWYLNDHAALASARTAPDGGRLSQPVLLVNGDFDQVRTIIENRQDDLMHAACADLTVTSLPAGHPPSPMPIVFQPGVQPSSWYK